MSSRVASYFAAFAVILAHNTIFPVRGQPTVQDSEHKEQLTIELFGQLNKQVQNMQDLLTESMQDMKNQLETVKRSLDQRLNEHDIFIKNQTQNSRKPAVGLPFQLEVDFGDGSVLLPIVNNWIIIMHRFDGSLNFSRNWTEYRNGFGDIGRGEFWLGNEIVHRLTNTSGSVYTLRIEVLHSTIGRWFYAEYATFSLDSESNKYTLHLSGYSGNAGDSLTDASSPSHWYHGGMSFSTSDNDNDRSPSTNWARYLQGGWWFNNFDNACLTCSYNQGGIWYSLRHLPSGGNGLLRAVRMMIKSK